MREFLREWKIKWCEEKKEEEGFCREKEEELWGMWRDEGNEENGEEKETIGNRWENKGVGTHLMAKLHVV